MRQRPKFDTFQRGILHFSVKYKLQKPFHSNNSSSVFMKRFYISLLKTDHFWSFRAFWREIKFKIKTSCNLGKIFVCKLFYVPAQFPFTITETELVYHYEKLNEQVTERLKT